MDESAQGGSGINESYVRRLCVYAELLACVYSHWPCFVEIINTVFYFQIL